MKLYNLLKLLSITAYFFIILKGEMIGVPFIVYLFFSLCDMGTASQVYSAISFVGIILIIRLTRYQVTTKRILLEILALLLLLLPVVVRLSCVPLRLFNYSAFIFPAILFIALYFLSIIFLCRQIPRPQIIRTKT